MIDKKKLIEELLECVVDATDTETQITSLTIAGQLMIEVLDEALSINGVVFNEAENYVQTDWKCQKQCDCIDKDDCKEKSEVELCEHPFHLVMSKCNGESNHCLKCGEHF